ncbi:F-box protein-like protein isoform X1 [Tanacetum coccineum]
MVAGGSKRLITDTRDKVLISSANAVLSNDDLLTEILLLLPAFSLLLYKPVSKQWLSVITCPTFTLLHSQTSNIDPPSGLFVRGPKLKPKRKSISINKSKRNMFEYAFISFDIRVPSKKSSVFTFGSKAPAKILQSCNGLLLCHIKPYKFFVYNPCVNMFKMLPQPHMSKLKPSSSIGAELSVCCSGCIYISTVASSTVIFPSKCWQFEHSAFLEVPENSFEVLKLLENSVEVLKILENKLESMKILKNKLESLKLQENQPVDGLCFSFTVGGVFLQDEDRRLYEEMVRLQGLGTYTDDQIMTMVRQGKQRGHIPGVGRVLAGRGKDVLDVDELKRSNKQLQKQIDMITKAMSSDDRYSQLFTQLQSQHESGSGSGCGAGGDDESGDDEDADEDEEDADS